MALASNKAAVISLVLVLFCSNSISAEGLSLKPEINIQETYSDNVFLTSTGSKSNDFITVFTPGFVLLDKTRRLDIKLSYSLQNVFYMDNGSYNDQFNLLDSDNKIELIDDHGFLNFSANIFPQNNLSGNVRDRAVDTLSIQGNRTDAFTYRIGPSWKQRIGDISNINLEYERNGVISDLFNSNQLQNRISNSTSNRYYLTASAGPRFQRLLWKISYDDNNINHESGQNVRFRDLDSNFTFLLTRKFGLTAEFGYEDNVYSNVVNAIGGRHWKIGFTWNPSMHTSVSYAGGERYFGTDQSAKISYNHKKIRLSFIYKEMPQTTRTRLLQRHEVNFTNSFGEPVVNPNITGIGSTDFSQPLQTDEVYISRRATTAFEYKSRKNKITMQFNFVKRDYQLTREKEIERDLGFTWEWYVGRRTKSILFINWIKDKFRTGEDSEFGQVKYTLRRDLSDVLYLDVGYQYAIDNSNLPGRDFEENRIYASLNKTF